MTETAREVLASPTPLAPTFEALVASRKEWLADVLKSWCQRAPRAALRLAELEWTDIAGKISAEKSLWAWAWGRFPDLVHSELNSIDESSAVTVVLKNGEQITGYPDARQSEQGQLVLVCRDPQTGRSQDAGPFSIDSIDRV
ncbi:MAG: hypothetical protein JWM11_7183, partial [Planctomycetaceae bacterium]|nr:hypothetical protein [Planctomycetaceae bacterium]